MAGRFNGVLGNVQRENSLPIKMTLKRNIPVHRSACWKRLTAVGWFLEWRLQGSVDPKTSEISGFWFY